MKLAQLESHQLWSVIDQCQHRVAKVRSSDDGANIDAVDELETQLAYLAGLHRARRRTAPLVFQSQLDGALTNLSSVLSCLDNAAVQTGTTRAQYLQQAQQYMANVFANLGSWGAITPTKADERLEVAVVDELLAYNKRVDRASRSRLADVRKSAESIQLTLDEVRALAEESQQQLAASVLDAKRAVESEQVRIGTVIDEGQKTIAGFEGVFAADFGKWQSALTAQFRNEMNEFRAAQQRLLVSAEKEYAELKGTVADYQSIVQADSADRLAKHYELESKSSKTAGWLMLAFGIVILLGAAVPLLLVVLHPYLNQLWDWSLKEPDWPSLTARAGLAAVLAAAATVAIRMGSGFHRRSDQYKRLAMELRTMGPFLSTVSDTESVDQARLDLVNRAFGQSYGVQPEPKADADTVPVTLLQQIFTMISRSTK